MRQVGAFIGQGLAQGMMSALGAVTAAANALVAQAERAAQAKGQIASPSKLFRDNVGRWLAEGVAVGITRNADSVEDAIAETIDRAQEYTFSSGLGMDFTASLDHQLGYDAPSKPAELTLNLGKQAYRAFVSDITSAQNLELRLDTY